MTVCLSRNLFFNFTQEKCGLRTLESLCLKQVFTLDLRRVYHGKDPLYCNEQHFLLLITTQT